MTKEKGFASLLLPNPRIFSQHPDSILSNLLPLQIALLFHIKLSGHHVMLLTAYSSLFHLWFQHQGQDWRCHQQLKKKVPDTQDQCPKSTSPLPHTHRRYFKELLLLMLSNFSLFQACKSIFVSRSRTRASKRYQN